MPNGSVCLAARSSTYDLRALQICHRWQVFQTYERTEFLALELTAVPCKHRTTVFVPSPTQPAVDQSRLKPNCKLI